MILLAETKFIVTKDLVNLSKLTYFYTEEVIEMNCCDRIFIEKFQMAVLSTRLIRKSNTLFSTLVL